MKNKRLSHRPYSSLLNYQILADNAGKNEHQQNQSMLCMQSCMKVAYAFQLWCVKFMLYALNGSQLAKMKKSIPDMSLPSNS